MISILQQNTMKYYLSIALILLTISCSREGINESFNKVVDFNSSNLGQELNDFSNFFVTNNADATFVLEFYDSIYETGETKIGAYFSNFPFLNKKNGILSIGELSFTSSYDDQDDISFVQEGVETFRFEGSNCWIQKIENVDKFLDANVKFNLNYDAMDVLDLSVKVPPILNIKGNSTESGFSQLFQNIERDNYNLTWNQDLNNEKGVLLMLRYSGKNVDDLFETTSSSIIRFLIFEDDGSEQLPISLLEGIPDGGMVEIEFWRGDVGKRITQQGHEINVDVVSKSFLHLIVN